MGKTRWYPQMWQYLSKHHLNGKNYIACVSIFIQLLVFTISSYNHLLIMDKSGKNVDSLYIPYIDGLRAIAILAVLIYHLNSTWLPGGFTGVDIFFTISGFVVSFSIAKKRDLSPRDFLLSFYARRILRIVPALLVCLIFVSLAEVLFIPTSWLSNGIEETGSYAFFGLSNLILMKSGNSYFGPRAEFNPFTHTWSLGIEEQFYLIFPTLFYWWTITNKNKRFKYISISLFTLFFAISITCAWRLSLVDTAATYAFYSILTRFWELADGVLLYQVIAYDKYNNSGISSGNRYSIGVYISLGLVILGFVFARPDSFPFPGAILPVLGTTGLLFCLRSTKNNIILTGLTNQFLVFIGKISYSLYLWHWPVFILFRWTVGLDSISCYVVATFLSFCLAITSYYFVECPIRYSGRIRGLSRTKIIFIGLLIIGFTYYIVNGQIFPHKAELSLNVFSKEDKPWDDINTYNKLSGNCFTESSARSIKGGDVISFSKPHCPQKGSSRLFVVGDSHATVYIPTLQLLTIQTNINASLYSKEGCPYIDFFAPMNTHSSDCQLFYRSTTADILNHAQYGDIVFLPSLRLKRFAEQWKLFPEQEVREEMFGISAQSLRASAVEDAIILLKQFSQRGIKVVFEAPPPIFRAPTFRCLDWFNYMNPICKQGLEMQKNVLINYRRPVMQSIQKISTYYSNVSVWDPFPHLCSGNVCKAVVNHKPLFFDGDHLSNYGNKLIYPSFKTFMTRLIQVTPDKTRPSKSETMSKSGF